MSPTNEEWEPTAMSLDLIRKRLDTDPAVLAIQNPETGSPDTPGTSGYVISHFWFNQGGDGDRAAKMLADGLFYHLREMGHDHVVRALRIILVQGLGWEAEE